MLGRSLDAGARASHVTLSRSVRGMSALTSPPCALSSSCDVARRPGSVTGARFATIKSGSARNGSSAGGEMECIMKPPACNVPRCVGSRHAPHHDIMRRKNGSDDGKRVYTICESRRLLHCIWQCRPVIMEAQSDALQPLSMGWCKAVMMSPFSPAAIRAHARVWKPLFRQHWALIRHMT